MKEKIQVISIVHQTSDAEYESTEMQLTTIKNFCAAEGMELVASFIDPGTSSDIDARKIYEDLIRFVKANSGAIKYCMFTNISVLERRPEIYMQIQSAFSEHRVILRFVPVGLKKFEESLRWQYLIDSAGKFEC